MVRSEKTRQLIIEKTASIFNKKGYTGTYLSDLTNATGLTKGSIYGNFKNKNEVAVEAFRYNYKFQTEQVAATLAQEDHAAKKLILFLDYYRTAFKAICNNGGCAILNTAIDADDGNDSLKAEVIGTIQNWHKRIAEIVKRGIEKGELINIDAGTFSYRMIALIEGSIMLAKTLDKPQVLWHNMDHLEKEIRDLTQK